MSLQSFHTPSFLLGLAGATSVYLLYQNRRLLFRTRTPRRKKDSELLDTPDLDLRLLRKAEAVIQQRTTRLVVVIERCTNDHNHSAILRTAEALGIQHVYIIDPPAMTDGLGNQMDKEGNIIGVAKTNTGQTHIKLTTAEVKERQKHRLFAQNATEWLDIHEYSTTKECIEDLKSQGYEIWATDLAQEAVSLGTDAEETPLPSKLAIVFGTEAVGCSQEMLEKADMRVYLPLRGFADSLNLSVATALVVHHLFLLEPSLVGDISESEKRQLRTQWFTKLAQQRLLSAKDKRQRKKLQTAIDNCNELQVKQDAGEKLTDSQLSKLSKLLDLESSLKAIDEANHYDPAQVQQAVADLVDNPPSPLTDLRRADSHRVSYVGKNTKSRNKEHWKEMPAVSNAASKEYATAKFFRDRLGL